MGSVVSITTRGSVKNTKKFLPGPAPGTKVGPWGQFFMEVIHMLQLVPTGRELS
jgi:hypothetical protein